MAYRVTDTEVKTIIETSLTTTPFIQAANAIVTARLTGEGLSDETLKQIELWLAAHLVAVRDKRLVKEKIGEAENTYQAGKLGQGLMATEYGQQVVLLDTTGNLSKAGKGAAAFDIIGEY